MPAISELAEEAAPVARKGFGNLLARLGIGAGVGIGASSLENNTVLDNADPSTKHMNTLLAATTGAGIATNPEKYLGMGLMGYAGKTVGLKLSDNAQKYVNIQQPIAETNLETAKMQGQTSKLQLAGAGAGLVGAAGLGYLGYKFLNKKPKSKVTVSMPVGNRNVSVEGDQDSLHLSHALYSRLKRDQRKTLLDETRDPQSDEDKQAATIPSKPDMSIKPAEPITPLTGSNFPNGPASLGGGQSSEQIAQADKARQEQEAAQNDAQKTKDELSKMKTEHGKLQAEIASHKAREKLLQDKEKSLDHYSKMLDKHHELNERASHSGITDHAELITKKIERMGSNMKYAFIALRKNAAAPVAALPGQIGPNLSSSKVPLVSDANPGQASAPALAGPQVQPAAVPPPTATYNPRPLLMSDNQARAQLPAGMDTAMPNNFAKVQDGRMNPAQAAKIYNDYLATKARSETSTKQDNENFGNTMAGWAYNGVQNKINENPDVYEDAKGWGNGFLGLKGGDHWWNAAGDYLHQGRQNFNRHLWQGADDYGNGNYRSAIGNGLHMSKDIGDFAGIAPGLIFGAAANRYDKWNPDIQSTINPDIHSRAYKVGDQGMTPEQELQQAYGANYGSPRGGSGNFDMDPNNLQALQRTGYFHPDSFASPENNRSQFSNPMVNGLVHQFGPMLFPQVHNQEESGGFDPYGRFRQMAPYLMANMNQGRYMPQGAY